MQNTTSQHSLIYENSTHYCSIQKDHSQIFSIVFILCVGIRTQSTFLLNFPPQNILNIRKKNPFPLNKKNSLSITFMLKWPSSLMLLSLRIISLNRTSIIQPTVSIQHLSWRKIVSSSFFLEHQRKSSSIVTFHLRVNLYSS